MKSRRRFLTRAAATATALAVGLAGVVALVTDPAQAKLKTVETSYAYQASAYGTRVAAGDESGSLGSGPTAWAILGCTKLAPVRHHQNGSIGKVNSNGMVEVGAVTSRAWSYRAPKRNAVGTRGRNTVSDVVLGDPAGAHLSIGTVRTTAHAFAREGRLGSSTRIVWSDLDIALSPGDEPATGTPLDDLVDAINEDADEAAMEVIREAGKIDIPGVGRVSFGWERTPVKERLGFATANAYALRIKLENGSRVDIGRAWAKVREDMPAGVLGGHAYGSEATAVSDGVTLGRLAKRIMPCQGTDGEWEHNRASGLQAPGILGLDGVHSAVKGIQRDDGSAKASTYSEIASVDVGGGQLVIKGLRAQANVRQDQTGRIVARNIRGTTAGSIWVDGERHEFPAGEDELTIPGVARLERDVVSRGPRVVRVLALRVTLLDDSGLVLRLGFAKARIARR